MTEKSARFDKISLGVCYYPEQWDESLWEDDLNRMLDMGIQTVRVAEFAWNVFEPHDGEFTFELFDRFLALAEKTGMKVIFGTPTATPPAWLTHKYPEVLNADINGVLYRHGSRRHYNYNSPVYKRCCARIVEVLAEHYGDSPVIVGWQIDNELNAEANRFYSDADSAAFREFVRERYVTLDALNRAWGARFWNQTYTDWEEIFVPRRTTNGATNPHLMLDYLRFISESVIGFVKLQADILRKHVKTGAYITTNGMFPDIDNHKMTDEQLDFYMYDSYPNFAYGTDGHGKRDFGAWSPDRGWSRDLSVTRSISPNFGIMEQQSGANSWNIWGLSPSPKPGQMTLWTMQSIAHGADYVSYFRWRTAAFGTEIYWHGLLNYDNRDNRKTDELRRISEAVEKLQPVTGKRYRAEFGVIRDYDNIFDAEIDQWHSSVEWESADGIFRAAELTHTPFDYVYINESTPAEKLAQYPVLFYPHAMILTEKIAALLEAYVRGGGKLVLACRTGYKDEYGQCRMMPLPCHAAPLAGIDIKDSTAVAKGDAVVNVTVDGKTVPSGIYNDILIPDADTEVIGVYEGGYYKGQPAVTSHKLGDGEVIYFGGTLRASAAKVMLEHFGLTEPYADVIELPECCEIALRGEYMFVLNYAHEDVKITLKRELADVMSGASASGEITLPAYGVAVYKM